MTGRMAAALRRRVAAIARIAAGLLFSAFASALVAAEGTEAGFAATVGSAVISAEDVEATIELRPALFSAIPEAERPQRALEVLIAEQVLLEAYRIGSLAPPTYVKDAMEAARRQVLGEMYASAEFEPPEIGDDDIRRYVEAAPWRFSERRSWRFHEVRVIAPPDDAVRGTVGDALRRLERGAAADALASLDDLVLELARSDVDAAHELRWARSEMLDERVLERLEALRVSGGRVDVTEDGGGLSALVLVESVASPVDPQDVRDQIADRLVAEALTQHRVRRLESIATVVLEREARIRAASSEAPPAEEEEATGGSAVDPVVARAASGSAAVERPIELRHGGLFLAGFIAPLACAAAWLWQQLVASQRTSLLSRDRPLSRDRTRGFGILVLVVMLVALLAPFFWPSMRQLALLPLLPTVTLVVGGCVLGVVAASVWIEADGRAKEGLRERLLERYPADHPRGVRSAPMAYSSRRALTKLALLLAAYLASAAVASI